MKFRLSTTLLLIAIVAVTLGWYVDRHTRNHREILGTWYYPTDDVGVFGYTSLMDLRTDGTFSKMQGYRTSHETFDGTFEIQENGIVRFHVTTRTEGSDIAEAVAEMTGHGDDNPTITQLDSYFSCRCAVDSSGYLVIDAQDWNIGNSETGIRWETHARDTSYLIRGRQK